MISFADDFSADDFLCGSQGLFVGISVGHSVGIDLDFVGISVGICVGLSVGLCGIFYGTFCGNFCGIFCGNVLDVHKADDDTENHLTIPYAQQTLGSGFADMFNT